MSSLDAVAGVVEMMLTEHGRHLSGANVVVRSEARV